MKKLLFTILTMLPFLCIGQTQEAIKFDNQAGELYNKLASFEGCGTEIPSEYSLKCKNIYDASFSNYSKAIELSPNYDQAYYWRALLQHNFGRDYYGSISDLTRAIELNPEDFQSYNNIAGTYLSLGEIIEAEINRISFFLS